MPITTGIGNEVRKPLDKFQRLELYEGLIDPQASNFNSYWLQSPSTYNRITNSCASVPYQPLYNADIFPKYLFHPLTPKRLYSHLKTHLEKEKVKIIAEGYGFLGFDFNQSSLEIRMPKGAI
ncbi:MAG: hypothetical protein K940chlam7_00895 [Chlamydiae bacterium]|nr:hypothetical protein [Chlamydiota bacterium]